MLKIKPCNTHPSLLLINSHTQKLHKFTHDKIIPKFAEHHLDRVQVVREAAGIQWRCVGLTCHRHRWNGKMCGSEMPSCSFFLCWRWKLPPPTNKKINTKQLFLFLSRFASLSSSRVRFFFLVSSLSTDFATVHHVVVRRSVEISGWSREEEWRCWVKVEFVCGLLWCWFCYGGCHGEEGRRWSWLSMVVPVGLRRKGDGQMEEWLDWWSQLLYWYRLQLEGGLWWWKPWLGEEDKWPLAW